MILAFNPKIKTLGRYVSKSFCSSVPGEILFMCLLMISIYPRIDLCPSSLLESPIRISSSKHLKELNNKIVGLREGELRKREYSHRPNF